ncbi:MAG: AAA family ATPase [bacterium]
MVEFLGVRIKSLKLTDHPVLGDLELDFTVGDRVADNIIIAGENGSGKTTLLRVIENIFTDTRTVLSKINLEVKLNESDLKFFTKEDKEKYSGSTFFKELLKQEKIFFDFDVYNSIPSIFRIDAHNAVQNTGRDDFSKHLLSFWRSLESVFFSYVEINFRTETISQFSSITGSYNKNNLGQYIKQLLIDIDFQDTIALKKAFSEADNNKTKKEIAEGAYQSRLDVFKDAFSYILEGKSLSGIEIANNSHEIIFSDNNHKINLESLSSGEKQIVFRGAYFLKELIDKPKSLCLIDEPEISMHPRWQKKIMAYYKRLASNSNGEQESQIFVATHSPFIIHEANPQTDKVIVLQKDQDGKIRVAQDPLFESCDGERLIEAAFNIDNFRKSTKPIIITEGKTDKKIIETAWEKLYPDAEMPFEILDAGIHEGQGGANHITSLLSYSLRSNEHNKLIGLFDNDYEGNTEMSKLKKNKFELIETSNLAYCQYPDKDVFGLLLPCPDHRKDYVYGQVGAKAQKQLVIEHYFDDTILNTHKLKGEAYNPNIFRINDGNKTKFAEETIRDLSPENFSSFRILFDALEHLLELSSEQ